MVLPHYKTGIAPPRDMLKLPGLPTRLFVFSLLSHVTLPPRRRETAPGERHCFLYPSLLTRSSPASRGRCPHLPSPGLTDLLSARFPLSHLGRFPHFSPHSAPPFPLVLWVCPFTS